MPNNVYVVNIADLSAAIASASIAGVTRRVSGVLTRPGNATSYLANDAVVDTGGALSALTNVVSVNGGAGFIVKARLAWSEKSRITRFRVHLWNATNPTFSADNAPWKSLYADDAKYVGYIDLPAMTTAIDTAGSDQSIAEDAMLRVPFVTGVGTRTLSWALETFDAITTPVASSAFTLNVWVDG